METVETAKTAALMAEDVGIADIAANLSQRRAMGELHQSTVKEHDAKVKKVVEFRSIMLIDVMNEDV